MIRNKNIICISPIDWNFLLQSSQEIMRILGANGNAIIYVENLSIRDITFSDAPRIFRRVKRWLENKIKGLNEPTKGVFVFSPIVFPYHNVKILRKINRYILLRNLRRYAEILNFKNLILWIFLPTELSLDIIGGLGEKLVIYHCIDEFSAVPGVSTEIRNIEREIIKKSHLVIASSETLYEKCKIYNPNTHLVTEGADVDLFFSENRKNVLNELNSFKKPIIGYSGGVHRWLDFDIIRYCAEQRPNYNFVFVGPLQHRPVQLIKYKNIHFLGKKNKQDLPVYLSYFDISISPYKIDEYTHASYPLKIIEYLAVGKPIVSTKTRELERHFGNLVYLAKDKYEFLNKIDLALQEDSPNLKTARKERAKAYSWTSRIEKISELILSTMTAFEEELPNWQSFVNRIYRSIRQRLVYLSVFILLIYILLFKTPLIWFVAQPLRISQTPQQVDVIVVVGCGAGETGSPGKSTIERARYGIELYQERFAPYIIFSTGYVYTYKEAEDMKSIAIASGVPQEAIILEDDSANTYEIVKHVKEILRERGFDSILLISSSYHMRRLSLVVKRNMTNFRVIYTPVPHSSFFDRSEGVRWEQIRAIGHEYLGILYYWWKGYI